jgi:hypothetical protein
MLPSLSYRTGQERLGTGFYGNNAAKHVSQNCVAVLRQRHTLTMQKLPVINRVYRFAALALHTAFPDFAAHAPGPS